MPIKNHDCIYECNKGIKCECCDCDICEHNPNKKKAKHKHYYASGMTLIDGRWATCSWTIEANSFAEAAQIAKEANVQELWLTHYSPSLVRPKDALPEARKIFSQAKCGKDGMSVTLQFE